MSKDREVARGFTNSTNGLTVRDYRCICDTVQALVVDLLT